MPAPAFSSLDSDRNSFSSCSAEPQLNDRLAHAARPANKPSWRSVCKRLDAIRLEIDAAFARRDIDAVIRLNDDFRHVMRGSLGGR